MYCHLRKIKILVLLVINVTIFLSIFPVQANDPWTPCKLFDPGNGQCLRDLLQNILITGTTEVHGMQRNSLDPYKAKKARIAADSPIMKLNMDFMKVTVTGLSQSKIVDVVANNEDKFDLSMKVSRVHVNGIYAMEGRVLVLNLSGKGEFDVDFANVDVHLTLTTKLVRRDNKPYFEVQRVKSKLKHLGDLNAKFGNLFADNQALTDSANTVFNQNWRELIEVMRPVIEESMNSAIVIQANKILGKFPASQMFSDID
ncbi:circadian clock-controlled protein daywake [Stomoxys calcitrans]|uniref:circadian clock-controlled protein daywake n=1 Tax=Stomoxys calcitrans TaxID=35570 RepID=UPI0027E29912|nr:circadian clock-controlled protein daywake [Stomoxys calcitrans]